ncbi:ATP-binding protein [Antarcticibacterium sp. 1MA-6-2]|uniref:sensor histidine kinase n=1 Tax=Antarcticibacterium sp. 1MA-6-2 TaxID=2908210 RepID=UPI001F34B5BA|nr:ATP-binding protein [Antarcticibacterium sp. 1MA-6-2]UJH91832.1 ATP-binding protein [Antarcticibacterium sp. 1MA-6-2]
MGSLVILDIEERQLDEIQVKALHALANQSWKLIEYGKQKQEFIKVQNMLKRKYVELEKFTSLVSHDIKSPLANIISLTELLKEENQGKLDEETTQYLNYLVESSYSLRNYVDGILSFYRSEHILEKDHENVDLNQLLKGIAKLYDVKEDVIITYPGTTILHHVNKAALTQVFLNLISNGLKYNQKPRRKIEIKYREEEHFYCFEVLDNGEGFPEEEASRIFDLFTTLETTDREGNPGSGIGLATVKKLVDSMGGKVKVRSTPGEGSTFSFTVQRL